MVPIKLKYDARDRNDERKGETGTEIREDTKNAYDIGPSRV